jgi:hypothetical protein
MTSPDTLSAVELALVDHFGHRPTRASVSFLGVQPIEVLAFQPIPGERVYVSLGMSRAAMTGADAAVLAEDGPRAELMVHVHDRGDASADVWRRLAVLAAAPVVEGVVYSPGMSVDLGEPLVPDSLCTGVLIDRSPLPSVALDDGQGSTSVGILQALPAVSTELAWCRVRGSAALQERWRESGIDLLDLWRSPVRLD